MMYMMVNMMFTASDIFLLKGKDSHYQVERKFATKLVIIYMGYNCSDLQVIKLLRYHGRWIDSVWKSRPYADALKENPINLTFSESLIVIEYNHIFEIC